MISKVTRFVGKTQDTQLETILPLGLLNLAVIEYIDNFMNLNQYIYNNPH